MTPEFRFSEVATSQGEIRRRKTHSSLSEAGFKKVVLKNATRLPF